MLYFFLGIFFVYAIEPLLEKIMCFILTSIDVVIGKLHLQLNHQRKILEEDVHIDKIESIGFSIPIDEEKGEENSG